MAALIQLAGDQGLRHGELLGLRWGDVRWLDADETTGTIQVERSYVVVDGEHIYKSTKTHRVGRPKALGPDGVKALHAQRALLEDRAKDAGTVITDETPVFTYDLEHPIHPDTASHYVRAAADGAGIDCHLHQLRHFQISIRIADGQDIRSVADQVDHASPSVTADVYSHRFTERDMHNAGALERARALAKQEREAADAQMA